MIVRLTSEPSRHRVAVWRELRRAGAVPVAQAVWVVPSTPAFPAAVERATELAHRGDGDVLVLEGFLPGRGRGVDNAGSLCCGAGAGVGRVRG